jgi:hypothetical protein
MSTYAANPAKIGVGKRYGARTIGGVGGSLIGLDSELDVVVHIDAADDGGPKLVMLPPFASVDLDNVFQATKVAFGAGAVSFTIHTKKSDGTYNTGTAMDAITLGTAIGVSSHDVNTTEDEATYLTGQYGAKLVWSFGTTPTLGKGQIVFKGRRI